MGKQVVVISHFNSSQGGGAVERVKAVAQETVEQLHSHYDIVQMFNFDEAKLEKHRTISGEYQLLWNQRPQALKFVMITSEPTVAAFTDAKAVFGDDVTTVLTAAALPSNAATIGADLFSVPAYGLTKAVLGDDLYAFVEANEDRIIPTAVLPILATTEIAKQKRQEWHEAAAAGKVDALPQVRPGDTLVMTILPGDLPGKDKPFFYTEAMAAELAEFLGLEYNNAKHLFTNGPRTSKFNADGSENKARMDGVVSNPVTLAFQQNLAAFCDVTSLAIAKGKAPPQGFLAGIDLLNEHVANGGEALLLIDGASGANIAEAIKIVDHRIRKVLISTPAPETMQALTRDMTTERGLFDLLMFDSLGDERFYPIIPMRREGQRFAIDDAETVAAGIVEYVLDKKKAPAPTRSTAPIPARKPSTGPVGTN